MGEDSVCVGQRPVWECEPRARGILASMGWLGPLFVLLSVLTVGLAFRGFRSRVRGGRFTSHEGGGVSVIETELGRYTFDPAARVIHLERPEGARAFVKLSDVTGVQVHVAYKEAALEELFIEGWSLTDFMAEYRDHRIYWDVVITTAHGAVPLAHMDQYKKRDWADFATPVLHTILSWMGLYRDGADVAASLENAARRSLRAAGINVIGGYGAAPTGTLKGSFSPTEANLPRPSTAPSQPAADLPRPAAKPAPRSVDLPPPPDNPRWESVTKK